MVWLGLVLFVSSTMAGVKVSSDEEADFSKYQTYEWQKGVTAARPQAQDWIVAGVERELEARGLRKVAEGEQADLYVFSYAIGEVQAGSVGGYIHSPNYYYGIITTDTRGVLSGSLLVELVDVEENRLVWSALGEGTITERTKAQAKIEKIIRKMFSKYPPR
jgi:hypothetical protein